MWFEGRLGLIIIIDDSLLSDHVVQCELKVRTLDWTIGLVFFASYFHFQYFCKMHSSCIVQLSMDCSITLTWASYSHAEVAILIMWNYSGDLTQRNVKS